MRIIFTFCILLFSVAHAQNFSRVKIYANEEQQKILHSSGVCLDHGKFKKNTWIETDLSAEEILELRNKGIKVDVLIEDVISHYQNQQPRRELSSYSICDRFITQYNTPEHFKLGSMGGYPTYAEILSELDSMAILYPSLISVRSNINSTPTHDGNFVQYLKISDNVITDETEPELLITALHHAREPMSVTQLLYFMWFLLENYGTNDEVTYLLDHTELYLIPVINPDGYIYNQTIAPLGGGMWRKNRRDNGDGTYGVDLNRNYDHQWGFSGVSTSTTSDVYLGPAPFSEPETQAVRDFCQNHDFKLALNYHSYGNLLLHPYGYDYVVSADHEYFEEITRLMVSQNSFTNFSAVSLYPASGDSDDWMYDDPSKPKIFSMTPEVGSSDFGFWPPSSEIENLCMQNVFQNLTAMNLLHHYGKAEDVSPQVFGNPVTTHFLNYNLMKTGLSDTGNISVNLIPLSPVITSVGAAKNYQDISGFQTRSDSIQFNIALGTPAGAELKFILQTINSASIINDTVVHYYGIPFDVYYTDLSTLSGITNFGWSTTPIEFISPSTSITESPGGNYGSNNNKNFVTPSISIPSLSVFAQLRYWAKWEIENAYDYSQVLISVDGGSTYQPLCSKNMNPGTTNQPEGEPLYDGVQANWVMEEINLNSYIGQTVKLKFTFRSDAGVEMDGIYFDDIRVEVIQPSVINENLIKNKIHIYPNPSSSYLVISGNCMGRYKLLDAIGNEISFGMFSGNDQVISTSELANGFYTMFFESEDGVVYSYKITILH